MEPSDKPSSFDLLFQNSDIGSKIIAALERVSEAFRVQLWDKSKLHQLSPIQIQILIFLHFHSEEKCTLTYLAGEFNLTKATVSDAVKVLIRKNLVEKKVAVSDARSARLQLTVQGEEIARNSSTFAEIIKDAFKGMGMETKETLYAALCQVIYHLVNNGVIQFQRMCYYCRFLEKRIEGTSLYCRLLEKPLNNSEIRIDCPEFEKIN